MYLTEVITNRKYNMLCRKGTENNPAAVLLDLKSYVDNLATKSSVNFSQSTSYMNERLDCKHDAWIVNNHE